MKRKLSKMEIECRKQFTDEENEEWDKLCIDFGDEDEIESDDDVEIDKNKIDSLSNAVIDYMNDKAKNEHYLLYEVEIQVKMNKRRENFKGILKLCKFYATYFSKNYTKKLKHAKIDAEQFDTSLICLICFECIEKYYYSKKRATFNFISYFYKAVKNKYIDIFRIQDKQYYKNITSFISLDKEENEDLRNQLLTYDTYFENNDELTERQNTIVNMLQVRYTQRDIAKELNITPKTIYRDITTLSKMNPDDVLSSYQDTKNIYIDIMSETEVKSNWCEEYEQTELERNALIASYTLHGYNKKLPEKLKEFDSEHNVKIRIMTKNQMYHDKLRYYLLTTKEIKSIERDIEKKKKEFLKNAQSSQFYL
jgi:Trp operon repressor